MKQNSRRNLQKTKRRRQALELKSKIIRQLTGMRIHHTHINRVNAAYEVATHQGEFR